MGEGERNEFLAWYESQKESVYDNRQALESYCQDDVTVLRQACRLFRRELMHVGNITVFLETVTIASTCNKVLRKIFYSQTLSASYLPGDIRVTTSTVRRP